MAGQRMKERRSLKPSRGTARFPDSPPVLLVPLDVESPGDNAKRAFFARALVLPREGGVPRREGSGSADAPPRYRGEGNDARRSEEENVGNVGKRLANEGARRSTRDLSWRKIRMNGYERLREIRGA